VRAPIPFFTDEDYFTGPPLTPGMVQAAQASLGFRLPQAYLELLRERNGGTPVRRFFRTPVPTSWAPDHIAISSVKGIGGEWGIDSEDLGSAYTIAEWRYPDIGVVICDTPSAGHDTVMLDYSVCGSQGEPSVVYVDEDRELLPLARTFAEFCAGLVEERELAGG